MADVQVENGHVRIANDLYEALCSVKIPGRHLQVMMAIIRLTYGWGKKSDAIGSGQLAKMTPASPRRVREILHDLVRWRMISREDRGVGRPPIISPMKDFDAWECGETSREVGPPSSRPPGEPPPPVAAPPSSRESAHQGAGGSAHWWATPKTGKTVSTTSAPHSGLLPLTEEPVVNITPLANLISKQAGKQGEKIRWLESGIGEEILAAAEIESLESKDPAKARSPAIRKITIARYRTYLKSDRIYKKEPPEKMSPERISEMRRVDAKMIADHDRAVANSTVSEEENLKRAESMFHN